jgi:hypothetical protein
MRKGSFSALAEDCSVNFYGEDGWKRVKHRREEMTKNEFYREANTASQGPLEGFLVLEACTTYAGPVAGA